MQAKFVTFEGGEGSGKTTLVKSLQQELEAHGHTCVVTREPGGCKLAESVRELVLHIDSPLSLEAELYLFLAARAQHVHEIIKPALQAGKWVLCDRFTDSTLAYQGFARGLGIDAIQGLCNYATLGIEPCTTFYLDIPPEEGFKRVQSRNNVSDRMEKAGLSFHQKVREGFLYLARQNPSRFHLIDAMQSKESVFNEAKAALV